jgi:BMFP domain-containing protein YqiC
MFKELLLKRIDTLEAKTSASKQDRIDLQNLRTQLMFKELLLKRIDTLEAKMSATKQDRIDLQNLRNQLIKLSVHDFG